MSNITAKFIPPQSSAAPGSAVTVSEPLRALLAGEIELRDTTSQREADSIRVVDALPRKVQTAEYLTGGYCIAKFYGPNRQAFARLLVIAPKMLATLELVANSGPLNNGLRDDATLAIVREAIAAARFS